MKVSELKTFLENMGYVENNRNSFSKEYQMVEGDDSEHNKLTIEYKVKKEVVSVYYHKQNSKIKRFKGRLKNLSSRLDGSLNGLTQI